MVKYYSCLGPRPPHGISGSPSGRTNWVMITPKERFFLAIEEHDFSFPCDTPGRKNVLIHDVKPLDWSDIPQIAACLVKPGLSNASDLCTFNLAVRPHECTDHPALIRCQPQQYQLFNKVPGIMALENIYVEHIHPLILAADEETVIYQHSSSKSNEIVVLDYCCGGFGGWAAATHMIQEWYGIPIMKTIGVDFDNRALQNWVITHAASYVETMQIPWASFKMIPGNIGLVADVNSRHWRQPVMALSPNVWCISAPCVSWSGAGKCTGFHSQDGIVLLIGLGLARMARPRILLLEQVKHFEQHEHFPLFIRLISWAGYRLLYQKVHEAGDHGPMMRPRWLGFAVDLLSSDDYNMEKYHPSWLGPMHFNPLHFGCNWELDEQQKKTVKVAPNILAKYFDHKLAPAIMKGKLSQKRSTKWTQQMPVLMANYGFQHLLDEDSLKLRGLFGHFLEDKIQDQQNAGYLRWWHPLELALMFFPFHHLSIPHDLRLSWKILGNAIASNHAIFGLATMLPLMSDDFKIPNPKQVMQDLLSNRMTAQNSHFVSLQKVWIIGASQAISDIQHDIEIFQSIVQHEVGSLKAGTFFLWGKGCFSLHDLAKQWLESISIPASIEIPPTFVTGWIQLTVRGPSHTSSAMIQAGMMLDGLLQFWGGHAMCVANEEEDSRTHFQILVIGHEYEPPHSHSSLTVVAYVSEEAWIQEVAPDTKSQDCTDHHGLPSADFNAVGRLHENSIIRASTCLFHDLPTIHRPDISPTLLGSACFHSEVKITMDWEQDVLHLFLRPTTETNNDWRVLATLWHSSHQTWWNKVGRQFQMVIDEEQSYIYVKIQPCGPVMPLPLPETTIVFLTAGMKAFLTSFSELPGIQQTPIQLKWTNVVCWEGSLPSFFDMNFLRTAVGFFMSPWNLQQEITFVCYGRRACDECTLQELAEQKSPDSSKHHTTIIAQPMASGGGGPAVGKKDWDINIRNQLAAALLPHGVNVATLPQMTETILRHHGRPKIQQILKSVSEDQKGEALVQLAHQAGFQIQIQSNPPAKPQAGQKKLRADNIRNELEHIDLDGITIEPGFLIDNQGKPVGQLQTIIPKSTGIVITKENSILSWLKDGQQISPDPLAVFLVGCSTLQSELPHEPICLPSRDINLRPILLSGMLVQLGQAPVIFSPKKDVKQPLDDSYMVSITAWKDETDEDHWQEVIKNPFRAIHQMAESHGEPIRLLSSWGVSCHQNSKPSHKALADSIQFHATIHAADIHKLLRLSGIAGTYVTPKNPQGGAMDEWRVIWLPTQVKQPNAHVEALRQLSKLDDPAGLVRSRTNYGVRVKQADYIKSFPILRPSETIPDDLQGKKIFKLTPFPFGTSPESIRQWLENEKWDGFPIKPLGPQTWIIAAKEAPQATFLTFNGHPILVRNMPGKMQKPLAPVVAGAKLPTLMQSKAGTTKELGPLKHDPWAQYAASNGSKPTAAPVTVQAPAAGFVQQKFQQQDDRITSLTDDIKKLKSAQAEMSTQIDQKIHKVSQAVEETKQTFSSQLMQLQKDLESSLHGALQSQNTSISAGFSELKNMMQQQNSDRRNAPHRRSRDEMQSNEDADM